MKIAIAAWHLKDFNVGLGRYTRGLIEAIGRVDRENEYEILMPDDSYRFPARPNFRYRLIRFPIFKRRFWEQTAPLLVGQYDVLHFPYDSCVAWKRGKFVTTIHDVKPLLFSLGRARPHVIERLLIPDRKAQIDHVITDSEASRRDLIQHLGLSADRLTVVYPGIDLERFRPASLNEAFDVRSSRFEVVQHPRISNVELVRRPYVLCVAGADPTKNVGTLIEAFGRLPAAIRGAHHLVLAGDFRRRGDLHERVSQLGIEKQTVFTGIVSDARLIALYQHAALFVFPSLYEGFGLPVLEAMACGCPVISSNASSLPEVAGEAAILIHPTDVEELTHQMARVLEDQALRRTLRERGLAQAAGFSWDRTAREAIEVYKKVVGS